MIRRVSPLDELKFHGILLVRVWTYWHNLIKESKQNFIICPLLIITCNYKHYYEKMDITQSVQWTTGINTWIGGRNLLEVFSLWSWQPSSPQCLQSSMSTVSLSTCMYPEFTGASAVRGSGQANTLRQCGRCRPAAGIFSLCHVVKGIVSAQTVSCKPHFVTGILFSQGSPHLFSVIFHYFSPLRELFCCQLLPVLTEYFISASILVCQ